MTRTEKLQAINAEIKRCMRSRNRLLIGQMAVTWALIGLQIYVVFNYDLPAWVSCSFPALVLLVGGVTLLGIHRIGCRITGMIERMKNSVDEASR